MAADQEQALREERQRRILRDSRGRMARIVGLAQDTASPKPEGSSSLSHSGVHASSSKPGAAPREAAPSSASEANPLAPAPFLSPPPPASPPSAQDSKPDPSSQPASIPSAAAAAPPPATVAPTPLPTASATPPSAPSTGSIAGISAPPSTRTRPATSPSTTVSLYRIAFVSILVALSALAGLGVLQFLPMLWLLVCCHFVSLWRSSPLGFTFKWPAGGGLAFYIALWQQFSSLFRVVRLVADDMFICLFVAIITAEARFFFFLTYNSPAAVKEEL